MRLPVDTEILAMAIECQIKVQEDISRFTGHEGPTSLTSLLEPCPCTVNQATQDNGRFVKFSEDPLCYVSVPVSVSVSANLLIALTHQCCYDLTKNGYGYSIILFDPATTN